MHFSDAFLVSCLSLLVLTVSCVCVCLVCVCMCVCLGLAAGREQKQRTTAITAVETVTRARQRLCGGPKNQFAFQQLYNTI